MYLTWRSLTAIITPIAIPADIETHLDNVATFFETGDIVPLLLENVRAFVHA